MPKQLIDNFADEAVEYARMYHLDATFIWFSIGAAYHYSVLASSGFGEFLDYCRKTYTEMRERLDATADSTESSST